MTLAIILNAILAAAVIVSVVTPLAWAIFTQHRDQPAAVPATRGTRRVPVSVAPRGRRRPSEPIVWPAR